MGAVFAVILAFFLRNMLAVVLLSLLIFIALRGILKFACHISNLRLFLLYGILRRSVSDG